MHRYALKLPDVDGEKSAWRNPTACRWKPPLSRPSRRPSPPAVGAIEHKKIASPAAAARHRVIHAPFYRFLLFR
jgi:hypothetical protein